MGAQLFERQGRYIKLTKYGEILQPYVIRTINSLEDGITTLKGYIDPNEGIISLAGFPSMAQFAPDLMMRYQSETNRLGVQFQYSQEGWEAIYNMLLDGENYIAFDPSGQLDELIKELGVGQNMVMETLSDQIIYGMVASRRGVAIVPYPLSGAPYNTQILTYCRRYSPA